MGKERQKWANIGNLTAVKQWLEFDYGSPVFPSLCMCVLAWSVKSIYTNMAISLVLNNIVKPICSVSCGIDIKWIDKHRYFLKSY